MLLDFEEAEKLPEKRNSEDTVKLRVERILEWQTLENFDYLTNCVFIDEAGFNMHIKRNFGRSPRGKPAKTVIPTQRGVALTMMGAICEKGVVNLMLKKPEAVSKKRKAKDGSSKAINGRIGTRTEHYLHFISNTLDILDKCDMKGRYLIMDNAPIHRSDLIRNLIEGRGYKCVYLPPYSPF